MSSRKFVVLSQGVFIMTLEAALAAAHTATAKQAVIETFIREHRTDCTYQALVDPFAPSDPFLMKELPMGED